MKKEKIKILLYGVFALVVFLGIPSSVYALIDYTDEEFIPGFGCDPLLLKNCYHYERRTDGPLYADEKGIDTTKWRYLYTDQNFATYSYTQILFWQIAGEKLEDFERESSTEKKVCSNSVCESDGATTTCILTCEYYEFIISEENPYGNTEAEPEGDIIDDENLAYACDDENGKYVFDYAWYASTDEVKNQPHTSDSEKICCGEVATESGVMTNVCTRLVAQDIVNQGYITGGEQFKAEDDANRLDDITGDLPADCNAIFDSEATALIKRVFNLICIAVPILLIVLGSVDFGNAVLSSDQEAMQKAVKRFTTRCVVAIAIFFLPMIVNLIFTFPGMDTIKDIVYCEV